MKEVGLYEAKTKLSSLVAEVEAYGKPIALTRHGRIVAEISPPTVSTAPKRGMLKSPGFFIAADFDEDSSAFAELLSDQAPEGLPPCMQKAAEDPVTYRVKNKNS